MYGRSVMLLVKVSHYEMLNIIKQLTGSGWLAGWLGD